MKLITSFNIDESDLTALSTNRQFSINGDQDAELIMQVVNSSQQFYNFRTRSFTAVFNSENNLNIKLSSGTYSNSITFPAASGITYTILLLTGASEDTELGFSYGKNSYSTNITQGADTTLTFTPATASGSSYQTFASTGAANITSTSSSGSSNITKSLSWDVKNTSSDANGFGLRLTRQPIDTDWYFETTETADGAVASDSDQLTVDDLTDLATGMELTYITGTTAPGASTIITAINQSTKTLTLSRNQAITDGHTMTFRAKGSSVIQKAIGANIDFSNFNATAISATSEKISQKVRSTSSSTTITLLDTYGVSGGGFVTISGKGVINTSDNTVQTVTADAGGGGGDGLVVVQVAQTVVTGTKIYFKGSTQSISILNAFTIKSHPIANKTIYLNLDNFITPGVSGS